MKDDNRIKDQFAHELTILRQQIAQLQTLETEHIRTIEVLERRNQELAFLIEAIQTFISTLHLDHVLNTILEGVRQCLHVAACSIWLIDSETDELVCRQAVGPQSDTVRGWRLAPGEGLAGWVAYSGKNLIVPDTRADTRHFKGVDRQIGLELRSLVSVPLRIKEKVIGALHVLDVEVNRFEGEDIALLESLAVIAAIAIENARLYEQAQQEIKERQRTEEALRLSEERFRQVVVSISDHIYVTQLTEDKEPANLYLSPDIEDLTGYPHEKFMADRDFWPSTVIHPDDRAAASAHAAQLALGHGGEIEYRLVRADGEIIWVRDSARVEHDSVSKIIYGVVSDITERKQLEEQLYQSQKMEAVGLLAGGIAHNFNNLMTVITGYSELMYDNLDDDLLRRDLEQINTAGRQAAALTKQLLAFSRKQMLQPKILDLNTVVANMDKMLRPIIGEDIDLIIMPEIQLGMIKADPGQMEQVIINLVINARDAMRGGGKVVVKTANVELGQDYTRRHVDVTPGNYVLLSVSDTGHGMDEETKTHIFEPFYTTKEHGEGTGLGLATVHGIIKQSGGHISVHSEPEQGTTFEIYLPRTEAVAEIISQNQRSTGALQGLEAVLLVEDEAMVRELAHRVLLNEGYTVLVTHHGKKALEICKEYQGSIHLLVTDVVIPGGMNGRELTQELLLLYPEMKVLYISGYPDKAISDHGVLETDMAFLEKPFTPNSLTRKVREVLDMG